MVLDIHYMQEEKENQDASAPRLRIPSLRAKLAAADHENAPKLKIAKNTAAKARGSPYPITIPVEPSRSLQPKLTVIDRQGRAKVDTQKNLSAVLAARDALAKDEAASEVVIVVALDAIDDAIHKLADSRTYQPDIIPKPHHKVLPRNAMGLHDDPAQYLKICAGIRDLMHGHGMDMFKTFINQDEKKVDSVLEEAKCRNPFLSQFKDDWATIAIMRRHLRWRRKYEMQKERTRITDAAKDEKMRGLHALPPLVPETHSTRVGVPVGMLYEL